MSLVKKIVMQNGVDVSDLSDSENTQARERDDKELRTSLIESSINL